MKMNSVAGTFITQWWFYEGVTLCSVVTMYRRLGWTV